MTPCISCPNESMNGSLFCYTCWMAEHEAREYHEAGTARLLAALEDLPLDDATEGLIEFAESVADGLEDGSIILLPFEYPVDDPDYAGDSEYLE